MLFRTADCKGLFVPIVLLGVADFDVVDAIAMVVGPTSVCVVVVSPDFLLRVIVTVVVATVVVDVRVVVEKPAKA